MLGLFTAHVLAGSSRAEESTASDAHSSDASVPGLLSPMDPLADPLTDPATDTSTDTAAADGTTYGDCLPWIEDLFFLRHMDGEFSGNIVGYTEFGFTKFLWRESGVTGVHLSGNFTNEGTGGFTSGIFTRKLQDSYILGAGVFFDLQEFQQCSASLELIGLQWAMRANGYFIVGDDVEVESRLRATAATDIFFEGNEILADDLVLEDRFEVAMSGFDVEVARNIFQDHAEAFLGGYHLTGDIGGQTTGVKAGLRGYLAPNLAANVSVNHDDTFGSNLYGGFTWFLGAHCGGVRPYDLDDKLTIPVERRSQIAVNRFRREEALPDPEVLTFMGAPITVTHVQAGAAGLDLGTFEDPFTAIPATQGTDIVYLHADGTFVGQSYTLAAGQRLLGEGAGNDHLVMTDQLGSVTLPAGSGGANRPIIQASPGDAITLMDDNEVSNLEIQTAGASGIVGDGVSGFDINRNIVTDSVERGIGLTNIAGAGSIVDNMVTGSMEQNIQLTLAGNFTGSVSGNEASGSLTAQGILIDGPLVRFTGEVSGNTADGNALNGISLSALTYNAAISGNTTNGNGDRGLDLNVLGGWESDIVLSMNTSNGNTSEGIGLLFSGEGTTHIEVTDNDLAGNNGGVGREFFAEIEDVLGSNPIVCIELEDNTSTNALGAGPPFNFEFDNNGTLSAGTMTLDLGTNVGTVELDPNVILGECDD